jgi:hypothetical protein
MQSRRATETKGNFIRSAQHWFWKVKVNWVRIWFGPIGSDYLPNLKKSLLNLNTKKNEWRIWIWILDFGHIQVQRRPNNWHWKTEERRKNCFFKDSTNSNDKRIYWHWELPFWEKINIFSFEKTREQNIVFFFIHFVSSFVFQVLPFHL